VPKKGDHKLLRRLSALVKRRSPFASQVERCRRQRQWLIDLEHLLDPERDPPKTSASVMHTVEQYLTNLMTSGSLDTTDQEVAAYIHQIFHSFWWGLFTCYDVAGLPRTNNALERFIRQIRMGYRRVSGKKNVHDYVIRYGAYVALIDPAESLDELLARMEDVDQEDFLQERKRLHLSLLDEVKIHRFRYHRTEFLTELEERWATAVSQSKAAEQ
jgi:hypothetical protein